MRVTFNSFRDESLLNLNKETANQSRLQTQISTGQKISRPDEDPLAAQKILGLQSAGAQFQQYYQNAGSALDISRSSYSAINELRSVSDRAGELAATVNEITTAGSYGAYATEVDGLIKHAISAANQTYDGKFLFGGTKTDSSPFTIARDAAGKVTSVSYVGAAKGPDFQVSENSTVSPYNDGASNAEFGAFINQLVSLRDALQTNDPAAVSAVRPGLQNSEDAVLGALGKLGAQQHRMEMSQDLSSTRYDDVYTRISSANDVDLSQAIVQLTKSQTAYQAGLQATAKIMSHSLLEYV